MYSSRASNFEKFIKKSFKFIDREDAKRDKRSKKEIRKLHRSRKEVGRFSDLVRV